MTEPAPIIARLDVAFEKARFRDLQLRAIYLRDEDWREFDAALSAQWGGPCHGFTYRDVPIRRGKSSLVYSNHGVAIAVPRRLSARTAA